jgi:protein MAK16
VFFSHPSCYFPSVGHAFLYIKTIERSHTPKSLWEKVRLSDNYAEAIKQINEQMQFFPKLLIHRNKQRLTKITQYLIRMRRLKLKGGYVVVDDGQDLLLSHLH